ncbi:MAG: phosphoglucosamine mutase, partial [Armatimonadota bacterium]|nr:phosphoglucosamine mutase [Armatimonadota bacterium]
GVAFLTQHLGADAGCVISASHNPAHDNGIKFFTHAGAKLLPEVEERIEALLRSEIPAGPDRPARPGTPQPLHAAARLYADFLRGTVAADLRGMHLVIDCAHGAAARIAPPLFRALGAEVSLLGARPDGRNINAGVGATHPEALSAAVLERSAHLGVAFDGDADRAIFVDEKGRVRNGDHVMYLLAEERHREGRLPNDTVVGTVMSNLGAERALARAGIRLARAAVGDREVFALMQELGAVIGGEQSGHIILPEYLNTGDGILTALQVVAAVCRSGKPLSQLCAPVVTFPQLLVNVPLAGGLDWRDGSPLGRALDEVREMVSPDGRLLVRPSGTEPILRVMVETPRADVLRAAEERILAAVPATGVKRQLLAGDDDEEG